MSNAETNRGGDRPYWMRWGPWNADSHLFWLSENILDLFRERNPNTTALNQKENAALQLAIELFKRAEIRNQKEVKSSRELQGTGEPCLVEGIEAYKQVKLAMGNPEDRVVNEMLAVGLEVLQSISSYTPIQKISNDKVQKVENFFRSASNYAFEKMSARHRALKPAYSW